MNGGEYRKIEVSGGRYIENRGSYYENYNPPQSLVDAAAEIQALLEQLDKTYSADTTTGKMAIATEAIRRIDGNSSLAQRILKALKAGGVSAIEQLLNHPAASFFIGALEDWRNSK